jgi:hypothetical protein
MWFILTVHNQKFATDLIKTFVTLLDPYKSFESIYILIAIYTKMLD